MGRTLLGVDVGGTKVLGVVLDEDDPGAVLAETERPTGRGRDALLAAISAVVDELRTATPADPLAVGLGLPGLVDHVGVLRLGANLPGILDADVGGPLAARWNLPVVLDNDGNCAARAEHLAGAGQGATELVYIGIGTGVSTGLVIGGRVVRGAHGFAGEAGHMTVQRGGPRCACGRYGCLEAIASGEALGRLARREAGRGRAPGLVARAGGMPGAVRGIHVTEAMRHGDPDALRIADHFAADVAVGVVALVSLLDPEMVVLGGSVVDALPGLVNGVGAARHARADGDTGARPRTQVVGAQLGRRAGAIGAALLTVTPR